MRDTSICATNKCLHAGLSIAFNKFLGCKPIQISVSLEPFASIEMSRRIKIIELWLFHQFDILVYIGTVFVTLGWVYSVGCQFQYRYAQKKILVTWINNDTTTATEQNTNLSRAERDMKYILKWMEPETLHPLWDEGQSIFLKRKCKNSHCYLTSYKKMLKSVADFDAIVFHGPNLAFQFSEMPNVRSPRQKYVFLSMEYNKDYPICHSRFDSFFNWTWTYRLDSDYTYRYLTIRNKKGNIIGPNKTMHWINANSMKPTGVALKRKLNRKTKAAAWVESDCQNLKKRETLIKKLQFELKQYELEVDVHGRCDGNVTCDLKNMSCLQMIEKKYYFYLVLENSSSGNVVTEKLLLALQNYAIPTVFGRANYTRYITLRFNKINS